MSSEVLKEYLHSDLLYNKHVFLAKILVRVNCKEMIQHVKFDAKHFRIASRKFNFKWTSASN